MTKLVYLTVALSLSTCALYPKSEDLNALEREVLNLKQDLRTIHNKFTQLMGSFRNLAPQLKQEEAQMRKEEVGSLIEFLASQYDSERLEPNIFKALFELLTFNSYERPKGSLTPEAFKILNEWREKARRKELRLAIKLCKDKLAAVKTTLQASPDNQDGALIERQKALYIIKAMFDFELQRKSSRK